VHGHFFFDGGKPKNATSQEARGTKIGKPQVPFALLRGAQVSPLPGCAVAPLLIPFCALLFFRVFPFRLIPFGGFAAWARPIVRIPDIRGFPVFFPFDGSVLWESSLFFFFMLNSSWQGVLEHGKPRRCFSFWRDVCFLFKALPPECFVLRFWEPFFFFLCSHIILLVFVSDHYIYFLPAMAYVAPWSSLDVALCRPSFPPRNPRHRHRAFRFFWFFSIISFPFLFFFFGTVFRIVVVQPLRGLDADPMVFFFLFPVPDASYFLFFPSILLSFGGFSPILDFSFFFPSVPVGCPGPPFPLPPRISQWVALSFMRVFIICILSGSNFKLFFLAFFFQPSSSENARVPPPRDLTEGVISLGFFP